jgi:hypothetical protein
MSKIRKKLDKRQNPVFVFYALLEKVRKTVYFSLEK